MNGYVWLNASSSQTFHSGLQWYGRKGKMTRLIVFSSRVPMTYSEGRNVPSVSNLLCDPGRSRFLHFKREQVGSSDL